MQSGSAALSFCSSLRRLQYLQTSLFFFHKTKVIYSRHACSILLLHSITGIKAFHPDFCWQLPASFTQQFPLDQGDNTVIVMAADRSIADPPCLLAR